MKPMRRRGRGVTQANHENRIQTLERRIPEDYPHWYGHLFDRVENANADSQYFTYLFPDECSGDPTECEQFFATDGEYLLFPTGHDGPFHVYLNVALAGGFANVDNKYVATDALDFTPSNRFRVSVINSILRDNAPFGADITTWAHYSFGEIVDFFGVGEGDDRLWYAHWIGTGVGITDKSRDRRALRFLWSWGKAADITFDGFVNIALDPPGQNFSMAGFALAP